MEIGDWSNLKTANLFLHGYQSLFFSLRVITALWKSLLVGWFSANKLTIKPTNGLVVTSLISNINNTMKRIVEIYPYNPAWAADYAAEAARLIPVFGHHLLAIHHIGSTAVPGLLAKPTIDILPVVDDISQIDALNPPMAALGYIAKGENGIPGRRYFRKGSDANHTHHIHVFQAGRPEIADHLNFRDYLRAHPDEAVAYGRLKTTLAAQFRADPPAYTNAKAEFIAEILRRAAAWKTQPL